MRRRRQSRRRGGIEHHPSQTLNRRRLRGLRRPRPRTLVALVALILLLGGVWLWLRDSSLVAVHKVRVTGASGPDASEIRSALALAAHNMTTLDVNMKQLRTAVALAPADVDAARALMAGGSHLDIQMVPGDAPEALGPILDTNFPKRA